MGTSSLHHPCLTSTSRCPWGPSQPSTLALAGLTWPSHGTEIRQAWRTVNAADVRAQSGGYWVGAWALPTGSSTAHVTWAH